MMMIIIIIIIIMMITIIIIIQFYYYFIIIIINISLYIQVQPILSCLVYSDIIECCRLLVISTATMLTADFSFLSRVFKIIYVFLYGTLVNLLFTLFIKIYVGQLRPHFLAVCKPNMSLINCSDGYITNYVCTGTDEAAIERARLV